MVAEHAAVLGVDDVAIYLADLQQAGLVPFTGAEPDVELEPLPIDATLAGRAFQHMDVLTQELDGGRLRVWLPLVDGTERLGVLSVGVRSSEADQIADGLLGVRLRRFATLVAEIVMTRTMYGDTIVRLRRRQPMDLAAELQWSLLPPLTFSTEEITVAGALEPAYHVAGDAVDYAVDRDIVRAMILDSMGHGLASTQFATLAVAAYRNLRRAGADLAATASGMQETLRATFGGQHFATATIAELASDTGRFRWVNAGHPPPLLLRGGRLVRELTAPPIPPLGVPLDAPEIEVGDVQLEPGDRVLLYTDGVLEARSPDGEFFGEQRLIDLLGRHFAAGLPAPETLRRVIHALLEHQQGRLTDDATMLLLEWRTDVSALTY
jgi:serine/threonine protein phosphatase PrpC